MEEDKLRQELIYMVKLAGRYDFSRMEVVEEILRLENERQLLSSPFGKRFKSRIFDIAAGQKQDGLCVICGQQADNMIICQHCMETIGESDYAKGQIKNKEKSKTGSIKAFQIIIIFCLILILFIQIWIFALWHSIPDYNPTEEARNSSFEQVAVASPEEAYTQLELDFPEEEGYTITFVRTDKEYVGRFLLDDGACCIEVEEELSDEERYDYFFTEDVYVFYISYKEEHTAKLGIAEINSSGAILIEGSFNDGRRTDSFYKFR